MYQRPVCPSEQQKDRLSPNLSSGIDMNWCYWSRKRWWHHIWHLRINWASCSPTTWKSTPPLASLTTSCKFNNMSNNENTQNYNNNKGMGEQALNAPVLLNQFNWTNISLRSTGNFCHVGKWSCREHLKDWGDCIFPGTLFLFSEILSVFVQITGFSRYPVPHNTKENVLQ